MFQSRIEKELQKNPIPPIRRDIGSVIQISGQTVCVTGLNHILEQGTRITLHPVDGFEIGGEIIALNDNHAVATIYGTLERVKINCPVSCLGELRVAPTTDWTGCVLDHEGQLNNGTRPQQGLMALNLRQNPPKADLRKSLGQRLVTKIPAIDSFLPLCRGQRLGLFSGSGVGKSTLLGQLAKNSDADINIITLIGERGREVRHFIDVIMGDEGMKNSIVFVATSDMAAALKLRTAKLAMATAEFFRDQNKHVLFLCDSLTRYAEAHREVALSAGEIPSLRAFPPSTFNALAHFCERAGPGESTKGDITAVFSVLVAAENMEEPIADMVRGILDGHIVLRRAIAQRGRFPAIDIRESVSRSLPLAATDDQNTLLQAARNFITRYEDARTLIQAGMYVTGADPLLDQAITAYPKIEDFISGPGFGDIDATFNALAKTCAAEGLTIGEQQAGDTAATNSAA